ncbi:hypothetical protein [Acidovorax sp. sic0104]|uniref:hypothetical protein n=1 Tax=Acidovorax sp. sic0104 TaxID=2854784 RepID=UPI001C45AB5B|nr:hypothetical protein [Acidovorax sp. sic0104]MBV7539795.1 hypothetical protein [Acidovorax sp. sic0104]
MVLLKHFSLFRKSNADEALISVEGEDASSVSQILRKEYLNLALRDAIVRHSVPRNWISIEIIPVGPSAGSKWDVRLVILERNGLLWNHATAFRATFARRLRLLDANYSQWVSDISWQFPVGIDVARKSVPPGANPTQDVLAAPKTGKESSAAGEAEIFIGQSSVADGKNIQRSKDSLPTPQQIQLEKLRELMSQGDTHRVELVESGEVVEFQETRPFESPA